MTQPIQPNQPPPPTYIPPPPTYIPVPQHIQLVRPTSGWATASLVCAILGLIIGCCTFGLPSILAVIFGHLALKETKNGHRPGHGMAVAGLILGYILVIPMILWSFSFVFGGGLAALKGG